jgi:LysR substrate binding domain
VILHEVDSGDPYTALRHGEVDVLVNWLAVDEPDLTTGPAISCHDRVLAVACGHRLARRDSVSIEDLAGGHVALVPPPFPAALYDAVAPPRTPSGRPIPPPRPSGAPSRSPRTSRTARSCTSR